MSKTLYVLNGPNMDLLGSREPETYGRASLADVEQLCRDAAARFGLGIEFRQSNHEGALIDWIHEAARNAASGIVINAAGYSTTSVAILDAIRAVSISKCTSAISTRERIFGVVPIFRGGPGR